MKIFKINDLFYICESVSRRDGFSHVCKVLNGAGHEILKTSIKYYNRTWESYTFQSVLRGAQAKLYKLAKKDEWFADYIRNSSDEELSPVDLENEPFVKWDVEPAKDLKLEDILKNYNKHCKVFN